MNLKDLRLFILFLSLGVVFHSCSSSESTVEVVEESPRTEQVTEEELAEEEQFTELTLGMIDPITNFDPLFAENLSTQRAISLLYEGLFTLDSEGNPVPVIANNVEISEDSLEYVITLDPNKYYQNSQVFSAGIGRRIIASDIKWAFERSAKSGIPTHAAELLMNIGGFENYYLEQRSVYDAEKRVLEGVSGIQVINRQTIGFVLDEKDPDFLQKLASPYLSIYPPEAVTNNEEGLDDNPVGTGPYVLSQVEDTTRVIFSKYQINNEQQSQRSLINRINLQYFSDEATMLEAFSSGEVDWIPEIGPQMSSQILNEDESLKVSYEIYNLVRNNADRITSFYLNQRTTVNQDWMINRLAYLTHEDFTSRGELSLNVDEFEITEDVEPQSEYFIAYTDDSIAQRLLAELHNIVFQPESSLVLFDIRIPTRQTSFYTYHSDSMHEAWNPMNENYWLRMDTQILGLNHEHVVGIEPTKVPWQLHIEEITVQKTEEGT